MSLFEDASLPLMNPSEDQKRDFRIAWLNRRVENLENIVFALLRDRAHYDAIQGYKKTLANPGFGPSSVLIKDSHKMIVAGIENEWPKENLGWPDRPGSSEGA